MCRFMKFYAQVSCFLATLFVMASCGGYTTPRPYAYMRLPIPEVAYQRHASEADPFAFDLSESAILEYKKQDSDMRWLDIYYPELRARVHCSYSPVRMNLEVLSNDAQKFVYRHAAQADAIPEQAYEDVHKRVYGVVYEIYGNTASPMQFVLTDSVKHFFRAAVYFDAVPNQDSIAPAVDYIKQDMRHLVETFEWNNNK